jgi:hypothetical protein
MFGQSPVPERQGHLRQVRPPQPVWIDLGAVYRVADPRIRLADGLDLRSTVPGMLRMWDRTTTGHWVGWVAFTIEAGQGSARVGQWVLADALRPRPDGA